jgi:nucleotide-binding universal stress UspA family protein
MRIVIGVDASEPAEDACRFVASRTWPAGTSIDLVATFDASGLAGLAPASTTNLEAAREALEGMIADRAALVRRAGLKVTTTVEFGDPAQSIIGHARESFAQLIVVGSRRLGPMASAVLGSVSAHLVDHAPCPVLVVRSPGATRMLLATDGSDSSRRIPNILASWGDAFRHLPVEVLSVSRESHPIDPFVPLTPRPPSPITTPPDSDYLLHERIAEQVADEMMDLGWHSAAVASTGDPEREILATAASWRADLIVTGSRGLSTLRRHVVGSVSHDLLMHSQSSLLVVRGMASAPIRGTATIASLAPA